MEVFKWCPLRNPEPIVDHLQRTKEIQFGDGYEQVSPDGINSMCRHFKNFTFSNDADAVIEFYQRHGKTKAFILDIPQYKAKVRFTGGFTVTETGNGLRRVTVEMKEVFR